MSYLDQLDFMSDNRMNKRPFISICILSYNRPQLLERLLRTIDICDPSKIEVLICDDYSPKRDEIESRVKNIAESVDFKVSYFCNEKNLGFDPTFCRLFKAASGDWLVFMGDDDEFLPGSLDQYGDFVKKHPELGYVMKSHFLIHENGGKEIFKYYPKTKFFDSGVDAYTNLFRRSVFISGFMIKRNFGLPYLTDRFDGTMLIQIYLLAEVVLKHPSAYFDSPFTLQYLSHEHNIGDVMFDREKGKFIPRKPTLDISINFLASFARITSYIDEKYQLNSALKIKKDMSKYFYHSLAVHRPAGLRVFFAYVKELNSQGFNCTIYYYIYVFFLMVLGKRICDWGIFQIKKVLGRTPLL